MKLSKILFMIVATAVVLTVSRVDIVGAAESNFKDLILYDDLSIAGQFVDLSGDRTTKFQEYREVVTGPQAQNEVLMIGSPTSSLYGYFEGFDMFRSDQSVFVEAWKAGKYKASFEFNQTPHRYSRFSRTIEQDLDAGDYTVANGTRTTLQSLSAADQASQIRAIVSTFTERELEVERDKYSWNFSAWLCEALHMELKALFEDKEGLRKKGTGTYMRSGDTFEVRGIELPEPVQYETLNLIARLTYAVPKSVTSLDWAMSYFHNRVDTLTWDNPFRVSDSAATGSSGASNRGNFSKGRVALYPDNIANTVTLSQALNLPYKTNLTGSISYGVYFQNDPFLPYTTNTAINTLAGFTVTDTSRLPKSSLEGIAHVISPNLTIINRAVDHLKAKAYINMYDYIDQRPNVAFPGYAAFGDSYWLTHITNDPITSQRPSFLDLKTGVELDYELNKNVSLNTAYQYKYRNLKSRQVFNINENIFKNGIEIRPWSPVKLEGSYSFGWRRYAGDYLFHREMPDARMFDIANKNYNQVDARVELTPNERLTVGTSGVWRLDDYISAYGLRQSDALNISCDAEYAPDDKWSFYTYYSYDQGTFDIASIAKSGSPNPTWPTSNTWFSDTREITNTLGSGVRYSLIPERLSVDLSYSFSLALQKMDNYNLVSNPASPVVATAQEWPVVRSDLHEIKAQVTYKIHKDLDLKAYYNMELYYLNDFAWDDLQPYLEGQTADNSTQYLWLDSRYSDYVAHVFGFALKYVF